MDIELWGASDTRGGMPPEQAEQLVRDWAVDILAQNSEVRPPKEIIDKLCNKTTVQATAYSYGQIVGGIDTIEKCKKKLKEV